MTEEQPRKSMIPTMRTTGGKVTWASVALAIVVGLSQVPWDPVLRLVEQWLGQSQAAEVGDQ